MSIEIKLETSDQHTAFAPLAVIGYCFTQSGLLNPLWLELLEFQPKSYKHGGIEKLQDILVAILAGCRSLAQVNSKIRPDLVLAASWQRKQFAEQSNLSRTLDQLTSNDVSGLRQGNHQLLQQHSQLRHHDWKTPILLDIDPTSLITSKRSEGSRKGWVSDQRDQYCRHILRLTLAGYHENLLSIAYPGNGHGYEHCKPAIQTLLSHWSWSKEQRQQIIIRSDAEQGTDANISYLLWLGFQVLVKGYSGPRTQSWLKRVDEANWLSHPAFPKRWMVKTPVSLQLGRQLNSYLLRWLNPKNGHAHAVLHSSLSLSPFALWELYDQRATTEIEIRSDKSGLLLHLRRKHSLNAQEAWILLTDVAHNLLAWLHPWMLKDSAFHSFGTKRITQDLFSIPGRIEFHQGKLIKVALLQTHPFASEMRLCLLNLLKTFDLD